MNLAWDYSELAGAYGGRPPYGAAAIDALLAITGAKAGNRVCDIGAGTGHLTLALVERGLMVDAVEPNDNMRAIGRERVDHDRVAWFDGYAEDSGRPRDAYELVTFGSSFNVVDPALALTESSRLLAPGGWFVCLWNHRDLTEPLQRRIQRLIVARIPRYAHGARRADQRPVIRRSGLFEEPLLLESTQVLEVDKATWINGWRSHATLQRQAGPEFDSIVDQIGELVHTQPGPLRIPYTTRVFAARSGVRR